MTITTPTFPTTTTYPLVRHFLQSHNAQQSGIQSESVNCGLQLVHTFFFALTTPRLRGIHGMLDANSNGALACDHSLPEFGALHFLEEAFSTMNAAQRWAWGSSNILIQVLASFFPLSRDTERLAGHGAYGELCYHESLQGPYADSCCDAILCGWLVSRAVHTIIFLSSSWNRMRNHSSRWLFRTWNT